MERTVYEEKDEDDMEAYSFMNHLEDSLATKEQDIFFREKEADFCCKI